MNHVHQSAQKSTGPGDICINMDILYSKYVQKLSSVHVVMVSLSSHITHMHTYGYNQYVLQMAPTYELVCPDISPVYRALLVF